MLSVRCNTGVGYDYRFARTFAQPYLEVVGAVQPL